MPAEVDEQDVPPSFSDVVKRVFLGKPLISQELSNERLSNPVALGALSPDAISSTAYGPEQILTELLPHAGLAAFILLLPIMGVILLILATNLFNLLDLRPGRAEKGLALLAAGLCLGAWTLAPLELLGIFAGPAMVGAAFTLRERAMLGDTGSNLLGAIGGVWLLTTLGPDARLIALAVVVGLTIYGELRSISATIESVPPLRWLDSLGRA